MGKSVFREDRDNNLDMPELDDKPKPSRWYGCRRRTFPQHPRGQYAKLLDEMIEQVRAKREAGKQLVADPNDQALERHFRDKERWDAERQTAA
jgi:hypothetical protein